jgi:hypothetical protein
MSGLFVPAGDGDWITAFEIRRLFGADLRVEKEARELWENATLRAEMSHHGGDLDILVEARRRLYYQVVEQNMNAYELARAYIAGAHCRSGFETNFYWWPKIIEGEGAAPEVVDSVADTNAADIDIPDAISHDVITDLADAVADVNDAISDHNIANVTDTISSNAVAEAEEATISSNAVAESEEAFWGVQGRPGAFWAMSDAED